MQWLIWGHESLHVTKQHQSHAMLRKWAPSILPFASYDHRCLSHMTRTKMAHP